MSFDAGRINSQFIHPGEAGPIGLGFGQRGYMPAAGPAVASANGYADDRRNRANEAAARRSTSRRLLPVAIAILAGLVFVTLTEGGRQARQAAPVASYLGHLLERLGLGLSEVTVNGQRMTRDSEIYERLQLADRRSIWVLDTKAARKRIEALPWVLSASLKRVFPDRLHIDIREREPRVIWNDGRRTVLLDESGRVLGVAVVENYPKLPIVFGDGAATHASSILGSVNSMPELRGRVGLYEWVANRRWTLHLTTGSQILLPSAGVELALVQLVKGARGRRLLDINFEKLDLRLPSQVGVEFRQ